MLPPCNFDFRGKIIITLLAEIGLSLVDLIGFNADCRPYFLAVVVHLFNFLLADLKIISLVFKRQGSPKLQHGMKVHLRPC